MALRSLNEPQHGASYEELLLPFAAAAMLADHPVHAGDSRLRDFPISTMAGLSHAQITTLHTGDIGSRG